MEGDILQNEVIYHKDLYSGYILDNRKCLQLFLPHFILFYIFVTNAVQNWSLPLHMRSEYPTYISVKIIYVENLNLYFQTIFGSHRTILTEIDTL